MPSHPTEADFKEGEELMKFFKAVFADTVEKYENFRHLPLLHLTLYGGSDGTMNVTIDATSNPEIFHGFKLSQLTQMLMKAMDAWSMGHFAEPNKESAGVEYDAIRQLIKGSKPKGEEGETK